MQGRYGIRDRAIRQRFGTHITHRPGEIFPSLLTVANRHNRLQLDRLRLELQVHHGLLTIRDDHAGVGGSVAQHAGAHPLRPDRHAAQAVPPFGIGLGGEPRADHADGGARQRRAGFRRGHPSGDPAQLHGGPRGPLDQRGPPLRREHDVHACVEQHVHQRRGHRDVVRAQIHQRRGRQDVVGVHEAESGLPRDLGQRLLERGAVERERQRPAQHRRSPQVDGDRPGALGGGQEEARAPAFGRVAHLLRRGAGREHRHRNEKRQRNAVHKPTPRADGHDG